MRIAIVAPSPIPFVMGGAERLWLGLQQHLSAVAGHDCELIKVPIREGNLLELVRAYRSFAELDLSHYDRVISTKYPAWAVSHPHHSVYMQHMLRGLYDTYHFSGQPENIPADLGAYGPIRKDLLTLVGEGPTANDGLIEVLNQLEAAFSEEALDAEVVRFPGPVARDVIHLLDQVAMHPARIERFAAQSHTVARRLDYFPSGVSVDVAYPPPLGGGFSSGSDDFLFTASRLEHPKRIDMIIAAMQEVSTDIPLYIAGEGDDLARLKTLAEPDPRIVFLGQISEDALRKHYANALAVPFVPYDEDYGYITIEAMLSGKPVVTTLDAGGPTEFVIDGETGRVVAPEVRALGQALDALVRDPAAARRMGQKAAAQVSGISWAAVERALLGETASPPELPSAQPARAQGRRRVCGFSTFPVSPARGGGQQRVLNICRELSRTYDVEIISFVEAAEAGGTTELSPGLREISIPKSPRQAEQEAHLSSDAGWLPVGDIAAGLHWRENTAFIEHAQEACARADVIMLHHPYMVDAALEYGAQATLWLDAHNVELDLKRPVLEPHGAAGLLEAVEQLEGRAWQAADFITACTEADLGRLQQLNGSSDALQTVLPNGYSRRARHPIARVERNNNKRQLGREGVFTALFIGSWHPPNIDAVKAIIAMAAALPDLEFWVVGSVCGAFTVDDIPANLRMIGVVEDDELVALLSAVDLALNPMQTGSGSNLKVLDYIEHRIPLVSTGFGARGFGLDPDQDYQLAEPDEFVDAIHRLLFMTEAKALDDRAERVARKVQKFDWGNSVEQACVLLAGLLGR
jgi:glycosyltransferase involved in cell wall biosynthesis